MSLCSPMRAKHKCTFLSASSSSNSSNKRAAASSLSRAAAVSMRPRTTSSALSVTSPAKSTQASSCRAKAHPISSIALSTSNSMQYIWQHWMHNCDTFDLNYSPAIASNIWTAQSATWSVGPVPHLQLPPNILELVPILLDVGPESVGQLLGVLGGLCKIPSFWQAWLQVRPLCI